jgi:hypothetical protein
MDPAVRTPFAVEENWSELEKFLSKFGSLSKLLDLQFKAPFDFSTIIPDLDSSYKENGYQYFFYSIVRLLKPGKIVEIGVLQGFSLLSMAFALRDNQEGAIEGYDLFDNYEFKKDRMTNVLSRVEDSNLQEYASVFQCDAYKVLEKVKWADVLHVDISNNGDVIEKMFSSWEDQVSVVIFEGGGIERDRVPWMMKYGKKQLAPAIEKLAVTFPAWTFLTLETFPSITICIKL